MLHGLRASTLRKKETQSKPLQPAVILAKTSNYGYIIKYNYYVPLFTTLSLIRVSTQEIGVWSSPLVPLR